LYLSKEFRSKGVSPEKTPQLLDSLETVSCGRFCIFLRSLGVKESLVKKTPQLLDSLEIVSCGWGCFWLRSLGIKVNSACRAIKQSAQGHALGI